MTTTTANVRGSGSRTSRLWQRTKAQWQRLFAPGDVTAIIIATALLLMPALSLYAADWPLTPGIVLPVLVLSVIFGFLLSRSYYNELLALLMSGMYGGGFVLLAAAMSLPGGIRSGVYEVFSRTVMWGVDAVSGGINQDDLVFTMLVASLFWFLGYNVAWHTFRIDRVSRVILPPGIILVMNSVYYSGDRSLVPYLVAYSFLALLLVVRSNLDNREWEWYSSGIQVPRQIRRQFNIVGLFLALLAVIIGWAIPSNDLQRRLDQFQAFMQAEPLTQLSEVWNRLFSTIDAYGPVTADYYGGDSLELSGAIQLGDQVVMQVEVPPGRRYYWRSRIFDTYQDGNWTSQASTRLLANEPPFNVVTPNESSRERVQQRFTMGLAASRLVYAAPQPAEVNIPVWADLRYVLPEVNAMNIYVLRPFRILEQGASYTATSLMSRAQADQLRAAGTDYPEWVRNTQLYVPPSVTGRTLQLASQIVNDAGAFTPYDKAKAIETWLRNNIIYNENIPQPPAGQDPIDWVLFDYREGYCNYYASAMIMMLRAQGVPARMGAGFAQGEWDGQAFIVRERDAHTWVEVYFPGYGWIEFEPTAAQAPLERGDEPAQAPQPTATPQATATPTLTPSPSVTPTPDATQPSPEQEALTLPTVTPTFTPTPTATPVIIPTTTPPMQSPPQGPMAIILPALLMLLVGLLVFALIAAILAFVWWWWEWRGMRGFSPVVRAYARMERYVTGLLGLPVRDELTPNERSSAIARGLPRRAERPVSAITRMYVTERYGRGPETESDVEQHAKGADRAWKRLREQILSKAFWRFVPFSRFFHKDE